MKIASAKTKLDLYNKRFNVYLSTLDYYLATWHESHEKIKERANEFVKSYRESQFLFKPSDGVYETLGKILQNGAQISAYKEYKFEKENNLTQHSFDLDTMRKTSMEASSDFEKNLIILEKQIDEYIQFKTVTGWKFF